jgi:polyisoprenoid-binding protein YceI
MRLRFLPVVALWAAPLFAADTYTIDKNHSQVTFQIRHFVSKVGGRFGDFAGEIRTDPANPAQSSVSFTIKTASIDTNNPERDSHLRSADFFDAEKYPEISFVSWRITPAGRDRYNVQGTLTMHGVSKQVQVPVRFLGRMKDPQGNDRAGFELVTRLNRKDYKINWNKLLSAGGRMLGDHVDVTITLETVRK